MKNISVIIWGQRCSFPLGQLREMLEHCESRRISLDEYISELARRDKPRRDEHIAVLRHAQAATATRLGRGPSPEGANLFN